ncbi:glycosyltransferase family 4 protein [Phyllobacterium sp. YR531]|uniref:glycosyltransferase family 4 protein n=1 Tax=Phyllobacterium sp. YR531 TaxID=1144343 RepID=UPI00026F6387|nr:glycosyltransferase family 4 protein [Phyllobacterium sp. YR531]EJN06218.1 glycosyltransferase [Phyllobacterium sp. YR531]
MHIAFYAPLKSPNHPVPSGDREMARLLIRAMQSAGHKVELVSELRSFSKTPEGPVQKEIHNSAARERARIAKLWQTVVKPDLWFTYHTYYKAPDLLGPDLASMFELPYVTAEASYSKSRDGGEWKEQQSYVVAGLRQAALNICFTQRDEIGLQEIVSNERLGRLAPFIDVAAFSADPTPVHSNQFVTVAMMRPGDKLDSYRMLAASLAQLEHIPWTLRIVGDGPSKAEVQACFDQIGNRIEWLGQKQSQEVMEILYGSGVYIWPGFGEAYGIAYLEAQAAGLPVVAQEVAGVPEVVKNGITGILTPVNDVSAFSRAIEQLCANSEGRFGMGKAAREFVFAERSLEQASRRLAWLLEKYVRRDQ